MVERPDGNVVIEDDADSNCVEQERGSESLWKSIELYDNCLDGRLRDRRDSEQHTSHSSAAFNMDSNLRGKYSPSS
jgi:hypothetical protein